MKKVTQLTGIIAITAIIALAAACSDDSSIINSQNEAFTTGRLTVDFGNLHTNQFIFARSNGYDKRLIAVGDIDGGYINCVRPSAGYAVLKVWEVKDGSFIQYKGNDVVKFDVFFMGKHFVTFEEILELEADDYWVFDIREIKPSFTSGKGVGRVLN